MRHGRCVHFASVVTVVSKFPRGSPAVGCCHSPRGCRRRKGRRRLSRRPSSTPPSVRCWWRRRRWCRYRRRFWQGGLCSLFPAVRVLKSPAQAFSRQPLLRRWWRAIVQAGRLSDAITLLLGHEKKTRTVRGEQRDVAASGAQAAAVDSWVARWCDLHTPPTPALPFPRRCARLRMRSRPQRPVRRY